MPFKSIKTFFFRRYSSYIFYCFSKFKFFFHFFLQKNSPLKVLRWKKTFLGIISFETHSKVNLPPLTILKKNQVIFPKKPNFFSKNSTFVRIWENLVFQLHSTANFAIISWGKWKFRIWALPEKIGFFCRGNFSKLGEGSRLDAQCGSNRSVSWKCLFLTKILGF